MNRRSFLKMSGAILGLYAAKSYLPAQQALAAISQDHFLAPKPGANKDQILSQPFSDRKFDLNSPQAVSLVAGAIAGAAIGGLLSGAGTVIADSFTSWFNKLTGNDAQQVEEANEPLKAGEHGDTAYRDPYYSPVAQYNTSIFYTLPGLPQANQAMPFFNYHNGLFYQTALYGPALAGVALAAKDWPVSNPGMAELFLPMGPVGRYNDGYYGYDNFYTGAGRAGTQFRFDPQTSQAVVGVWADQLQNNQYGLPVYVPVFRNAYAIEWI